MDNETNSTPADLFLKAVYKRPLARLAILLFADAVAICAAYIGAFALRFPAESWVSIALAAVYMPVQLVASICVFWLTGLYRTLWRYASTSAIKTIAVGTVAAVAASSLIDFLISDQIPNLYLLTIQWMLLFMFVGAGRLSVRLIRSRHRKPSGNNRRRVLIYGAGDAGEMISRDIMRSKGHNLHAIGFIDDKPDLKGKSIHGLPIFGGRDQIKQVVEEHGIHQVVVAIPSMVGNPVRKLSEYLRHELGDRVELLTLPGISEMVDGRATVEQIRKFRVRDLLRRRPVELDFSRVEMLLKGKCVMVTGAGGSIGAEICRQVARCRPAKLVMFDISEAAMYEMQEMAEERYPGLKYEAIVGDCKSRALVDKVMDENNPNIIFHAAAYKHVPLVELNPWTAVANNIGVTRVLLEAAGQRDIERFVMISTDKAVRPTNMMGATKRICELLVQGHQNKPGCVHSAVRFGNVMGSSGSVIPKFGRQIKAGGPVTVTHPGITRFFMLTSEAVQLVLQSATLDRDGAIYVLDMGNPVKIEDLARDMIQLSGFVVGKHIDIVFTGLRLGEKFHEELYHNGKGQPTEIEKISVAESPLCCGDDLTKQVDDLLENSLSLSREDIYARVAGIIGDFSYQQDTTAANVIEDLTKQGRTSPQIG